MTNSQWYFSHTVKARLVGSGPPRELGGPGGKISRAKSAQNFAIYSGRGNELTVSNSFLHQPSFTESTDYSTEVFTH